MGKYSVLFDWKHACPLKNFYVILRLHWRVEYLMNMYINSFQLLNILGYYTSNGFSNVLLNRSVNPSVESATRYIHTCMQVCASGLVLTKKKLYTICYIICIHFIRILYISVQLNVTYVIF